MCGINNPETVRPEQLSAANYLQPDGLHFDINFTFMLIPLGDACAMHTKFPDRVCRLIEELHEE